MRNLLYRDAGGMRESLGLLILRVVVGAAFVLHGWPKIQNAFAWMGPNATVPGFMQALAATAEFGGGIALILGVLTPIAAIGLTATMAGALYMVHLPAGHPFVPAKPGDPSYELAAVYLAAAVALLLTGPGRFSLDALLFRGGACCGVARTAES